MRLRWGHRLLLCALLAGVRAQQPVQAPAFPLSPPLTSDQIFDQTLAKGAQCSTFAFPHALELRCTYRGADPPAAARSRIRVAQHLRRRHAAHLSLLRI
jgi:hypothetical protein